MFLPGNFTALFMIHAFYTTDLFLCVPKNRQKTFGFLIFLGGLERDQWHEMD